MRHVGRSLFTLILLAALLPAVAAMQARPRTGQASAAAVAEHLLGGFEDSGENWQVNLGAEFPGAQGQLTRDDQQPHSGTYAGRLHTDFSAGGNYVEAFRGIDALDIQSLSLWVRTADAGRIGLRLTDSTGQVHQQHLTLAASTDWQRVDVTEFGSASHWGGANDGVWHGPATRIGLLVDKAFLAAGRTSADVYLDDITVTAPQPALEIQPTTLGNVFVGGEQPALNVVTSGTDVAWTAHDFWGGTATSGSTAATSDGVATIRPAIAKRGYYTLDLTAKAADGSTVGTARTSLALLDPFDVKSVADSPFGIGTHFTGYSADLIPLLAKAGIMNVRNDLGWGGIETTKGSYDFSGYDPVMSRLDAAGINVFPIVDYTNRFHDNDATPYTDAGREGFANYSAATLEHYNAQLDEVEVYNEFNIPGFGDRGDGPADAKAEYYYPLLKATHDKLKAVDPDVDVIGPASAGVPLEWLETLFQLGAMPYLDKVSIHPYQYPTPPENVVGNLDAVGNLVKEYNNGQAKPLWITEQGWPTHNGATGVSEQTQAAYLVRAYAMALSRGVEKFFWYDFMNDGTDPAYNENNFGIIRNDHDAMGRWVPKPAYVAYAVMARQLTGATFQRREDLGDGVFSMVFGKGSKTTRVLWSTQPTTVDVSTGSAVTVADLTGDQKSYSPGPGGTVALSVSGDPVYVVSDPAARLRPGSKFELAPAGDTFVGDQVKLTLTVDNTKAPTAELRGTFEIAGTRVPVRVPARQQVDVPVNLPAQEAAGIRKPAGDLVVSGRRIARLGTQVDVRMPVVFHGKHVDTADGEALRLTASNVSERQLTIDQLTWSIGDHEGTALEGATLAGGAERVTDLPLAGLTAGTYAMRAELRLAGFPAMSQTGKVVVVPPEAVTPLGQQAIAVDGTLDDLAGKPAIDLAADGTVQMPSYAGADDLSGDIWFTWDAGHLYLSARVHDDVAHQSETGANIWQGDSIQFAVTPGRPGEFAFGYEYGLALTPSGPQVYRWSVLDGAAGPVSDVDVAVTRDETAKNTVYELALPWSELAPSDAGDGMLSLSMLVNDNDGSGRKGYIEWGSGIGSSKDAALFKAAGLTP
ncbi:sugar-binding protein [Flindersiella endophytica]